MTVRIVLASSNAGKIDEIARLVPGEFEIVLSKDLGVQLPLETGDSFQSNARTKAMTAATATGNIALGDDSGLEVDALGGAPGVFSARFAGEHATDDQNITKLLDMMNEIPAANRSARFRCAIALAFPDGSAEVVEGSVSGTIGFRPQGSRGFGYDPVFVIDGGLTFGELEPAEKDAISHRGIALRKLAPILQRLVAESNEPNTP